MRISVMEFGRFNGAQLLSGRRPEDNLIILHGKRERNRAKCISAALLLLAKPLMKSSFISVRIASLRWAWAASL